MTMGPWKLGMYSTTTFTYMARPGSSMMSYGVQPVAGPRMNSHSKSIKKSSWE